MVAASRWLAELGDSTRRRNVIIRLAGPALVVAVFFGVVGAALLAGTDDTRETLLVPERPRGRTFAVDLEYVDRADHHSLMRSLRLYLESPGALLQHPELQVLIATFETSPHLDTAVLEVVGSDCVYEAAPRSRLRNNEPLSLQRGPECLQPDDATGELLLTIRLRAPGRVAVWAVLPAAAVDPARAIYLGATHPAQGEPRPLLRGRYVEHFPETGLRRMDLLAYVWQTDLPSWWIWVMLAASGILVGAGASSMLPRGPVEPATLRASVVKGAGGFALAAGLGVAYAVLVPPFQAADEPNHFVAFGEFIETRDLTAEAARWAQVGHFERIQFHPEERFRPSDIGHPGVIWNDGTVPDSTMRGGGVEWFWSALAPFFQHTPAPRLLLGLRLINVVWFAACLGWLFFSMSRWSGMAWPQLLAIPLLWIPALPFFGMHVSNHATLLGAYLVGGAGALLLTLDNRHAHLAGPLIGAGVAAALFISRAAAPLAPFILLLLAGRLVLGDRHGRLGASQVFWLGIGIPLSLALYAAPAGYRETLLAGAAALPGLFSRAAIGCVAHPWIIVPAAALLALLEHALSTVRRGWRWRPPRRWIQAGAGAAAASAFLLFAGALVFRYPMLSPVRTAGPPEPGDYVADVLAAGLTLFRFGPPDRLTSYTFWAGFGWLETGPPELLVSVLATASGLALVALLLWIATTGATRAAVWVALVLLGYAASLAAYAFVVASVTPADLHGRYLLGLYVWLLLICWSSLGRVVDSQAWLRRAPWIPLLCTALAAVIHALSLSAIVQRYF